MKEIRLNVINVGHETHVETTQGGYNTVEIAYKDNGKVSGKKLVDFANKELYEIVKSLKAGDTIDVSLEKELGKDQREYWQWKAVRLLGETEQRTSGPSVPSDGHSSAPTPPKAGKVIGSNYETPEERALKQVLIVRQSSLSAAIEIGKARGTFPNVGELVETAEFLVNWVFNDDVLLPPALVPQVVKTEAQEAAAKAVAPKRGRPAKEAKVNADLALDDDIPF